MLFNPVSRKRASNYRVRGSSLLSYLLVSKLIPLLPFGIFLWLPFLAWGHILNFKENKFKGLIFNLRAEFIFRSNRHFNWIYVDSSNWNTIFLFLFIFVSLFFFRRRRRSTRPGFITNGTWRLYLTFCCWPRMLPCRIVVWSTADWKDPPRHLCHAARAESANGLNPPSVEWHNVQSTQWDGTGCCCTVLSLSVSLAVSLAGIDLII